MCESFEVSETTMPGKYLGMPMCVGKNKNEVFGFLNDRVGHKLQGAKIKSYRKLANLLF